MKIIHKLLLLFSIISCVIFPEKPILTPQNTEIVSDLDEVLIQKNFSLRAISKIRHLIGGYSKNTKGENTLKDTHGKDIGGVTFHVLYHGMRKPYLSPYVSWLVNNIEISRSVIKGTEKIYRYLKNIKGYHIIYATNKDRISYDICAQALGNKFTSLPTKTFVAHPGRNSELLSQLQNFANLPTTPLCYKELLQKSLTIKPTENILHVPSSKPDIEYYHYVENNIGPDKNIIFIDDNNENIEGFNTLQNTSSAERIGIVFKNPQQLAQELVNIGILSEIDDAQLLQDIRYPGIWGTIKLFGKKLLNLNKEIL